MKNSDLVYLVSDNIKKNREKKGLSQEALAHHAGLAPRHIQKIEAAQVNITLQTLSKIAIALGVEPMELLK